MGDQCRICKQTRILCCRTSQHPPIPALERSFAWQLVSRHDQYGSALARCKQDTYCRTRLGRFGDHKRCCEHHKGKIDHYHCVSIGSLLTASRIPTSKLGEGFYLFLCGISQRLWLHTHLVILQMGTLMVGVGHLPKGGFTGNPISFLWPFSSETDFTQTSLQVLKSTCAHRSDRLWPSITRIYNLLLDLMPTERRLRMPFALGVRPDHQTSLFSSTHGLMTRGLTTHFDV